MTATSSNVSPLSAPADKICDKFTAVPAMRPNLSQLFPPTGNRCNEFEGVRAPANDPNLLQLFAPTGSFCNEFEGVPAR